MKHIQVTQVKGTERHIILVNSDEIEYNNLADDNSGHYYLNMISGVSIRVMENTKELAELISKANPMFIELNQPHYMGEPIHGDK